MHLSRNAIIAATLLLLHAGLIAALQSGLLIRAADIIVPAEVLMALPEPLAPQKKLAKAPVPTPPQPAPKLQAIADKTPPAPSAPTGTIAPLAPVPAPATPVAAAAPVAAVAAAAPITAAAAQPAVQLPSSDADYLQNPKPAYPAMSRRLNEQGRTTIKVLIGIDGLPKQADIAKSSGFERLDQAALGTVMRWRFVPGKRNGVPEAMWFNVPFNWVLS
jgi:periplasmic protein TonB